MLEVSIQSTHLVNGEAEIQTQVVYLEPHFVLAVRQSVTSILSCGVGGAGVLS